MPRSLFPHATPETRARLEQDPTLKLFNTYDWSANPLGLIPDWPDSLKGAVRMMMVASTPMAMLVGERGILLYNNGYAEFAGTRHPGIFGLPAEEAWPEIADFHRESIERGMRGEGISLMRQELHLNRNGRPEPVWLDLHYSPMLDEAGHPMGNVCVLIDVTEQRQAALERELVAQELSHRIKNIFAVLTGIVSLSARSRPEVKPFADQLRQRIHALGEAHDLVRPHGLDAAEGNGGGQLSTLIARLMRPYNEDADRQRVRFAGDDTIIDDAAATPLGLLFHELATNAAKYGALSADTGKVEVTGHDLGETYRMIWRETGGPAARRPEALDGFGSRLVDLSVKGQLRGQLDRFWHENGLEVAIEVPKEALTRSARLQAAPIA